MNQNTKFDLLSYLICGFALSNYISFTIGLIYYDPSNIWFYTPIVTVSLTIFFGVWFMRFSDKLKIIEDTL